MTIVPYMKKKKSSAVVLNMDMLHVTLKMILFINTVVYRKLCCRGEKKRKSATREELISNESRVISKK